MLGVLATLALALPSLVTAQATYQQQRSQAAIDQQTQITDRFNKAVEQLGATDNLERRLGGIYSLERIARDSRRDHPTIMEVLSTFVRENTKRTCRNESLPVATDAQAALTVIGRRNVQWDTDPVDLSRVCLRGADLTSADLRNVDLREAHLDSADLRSGDFRKADLRWAHLRWAHLTGANLSSASLDGADLDSANLRKADLREARLDSANLRHAHFTDADLRWAHLRWAQLTDASLYGADLTGANLTGADLTRVKLSQVIGLKTVKGLPPR